MLFVTQLKIICAASFDGITPQTNVDHYLMKQDQDKQPVRSSCGGRPRKFSEASRPITVTLPKRTLKLLESVNSDRALAIAKAVDTATVAPNSEHGPASLVKIDARTAIIVVGPSKCLRTIPWLRLVEIAPARYLLSIPSGTPPERLELAITDLLSGLAEGDAYEHELLETLRRQFANLRTNLSMTKSEIILVDVQS